MSAPADEQHRAALKKKLLEIQGVLPSTLKEMDPVVAVEEAVGNPIALTVAALIGDEVYQVFGHVDVATGVMTAFGTKIGIAPQPHHFHPAIPNDLEPGEA